MRPLRGFSFPIVILLVSVLAAAAAGSVVVMASSARTTGSAIDRRRTFYACDGIARAAAVAARPYLSATVAPTTNGLRTSVCGGAALPCGSRAGFALPNTTVDDVKLSVLLASGAASPVPNGPFRGMSSTQNKVEILVDATNNGTGSKCRVRQTLTLAEISLFQFAVFADGYLDAFPAINLDVNGRVHVNGDFCAHSAATLTISQLTSAGRLLATCPRFDAGAGTAFFIRDATSTPLELNAGCHNACVNCGVPANCGPDVGDWRAYALSRWDQNALDQAHSVPKLRLPVAGAAVQDGVDASGAALDNSTSMRMLLDPPNTAEDPALSAQRFAMKADIRIIDGVWFKNDGTWPGVPIWSDHAGAFRPAVGSSEEIVVQATGNAAANTGQKNLFCDTATPVPRGYSYYAHDCAAAGTMTPRDGSGAAITRATVSYGSLFRGAGPVWFPGLAGTRANAVPVDHLRATRAGFQDLRVRDAVAGGDVNKYRMLPMNFDVGAFAAALADNSGAELGAHFAPGTFGGIVYIANTWPTVLTGQSALPTAEPATALWPDVHDTASATALPDPAIFALENDRLPRNLCSATAGRTWAAGWLAPDCAGAVTTYTAVNSVRIINAATLDPVVFPNGLSIVTNVPAYVVGDTNTGSVVPNGAPPPALVPSGNWRAFMVGADAITLLSSAWDDQNADWSDSHDGGALGGRVPAATTWVLAALHGNVETSAVARGGGIEGSLRFLEHWNAGAARFYGSNVIGFRSVLQRQPYVLGNVHTAPTLVFMADANLRAAVGRPPGAPSFFVQATEAWARN